MKIILTILSIAALTCACNDDDEKLFKKDGNNEAKPAATLLQGVQGLDATSGAEVATEAASVTYAMKITSNSGAKLCDGEATISIMSDFGIKFPEAKIQCVSLTVDLASILGAGAGLGNPGTSKDPNLTHDGTVLSVKSIAGAEFNPPRPFLLGPIIQDSSKYKGFTRSSEHDIKAKDAQGNDISAHGKFNIQVLDVDTSYENKFVGKAFDKVLHWQIEASGFDGVPAKDGLIFERMEWLWNIRPIMIPKIIIVGSLGDFIAADSANTSAGDLVGKLTIELTVTKYDTK